MIALPGPLAAAVPAPQLWWIDAALAGLLALALVFGAFNGLSGEAARLVAFAVALVAAAVVAALPPSARALPGPASASYAWGAQLQVSGYDASKETLTDFPVLVRVSPSTISGS